MPMFGSSRKRAASNPALRQTSAPPNASASLAATRAFTRDSSAHGELSSAAAAAALRSHSPAPTPVGDTVTKRMARKNSLSSQGSGSMRPTQNLRRHSSSGSMTERSFRDKSPVRSSPVDHDAPPPVPEMPKELPTTSVAHRRASSLEPGHRGGSVSKRGGGGRGVSLDRGAQAGPGRGQQRGTSTLSQVSENGSDGYGGPRSSVNFSRPMSPQQTPSPTVGRGGGQSGWFAAPVVNPDATFRGEKPRPKTSQGLSAFEAHQAQQAVQNAADRPVSTKRSQMARGVEGARLSSGSMRAKPSGSAVQSRPTTSAGPRIVDPKSPLAVYDPSTRTFIHKGDAIALHKAMSEEELTPEPQYQTRRVENSRQYAGPQPRGIEKPATQPQPVDEWVSSPPPRQEARPQPPSEDGASVTSSHYSENPSLDPPRASDLPREPPILERQRSEDLAAESDVRPAEEANTSRKLGITIPHSAKSPPENFQSPKFASNIDSPYPRLQTAEKKEARPSSGLQPRLSTRSERNHSLSPPRNAHFAPVATELNGVKHHPLPRSVSPAKSALKLSPSTSRRSYSPVVTENRLGNPAAPPSETSDAMSDGEFRKKKKNVRVSFEEAPEIAGISSYADMLSPSSPSGPVVSRWSTTDEEEDEDYSKPRPELPSFGSIRDQSRRSRDDERPEKVTETVSSSLSASAISTSPPLETSNDHLVGGILARDLAAKQALSNDPLPPEVTTVEGTGYGSDSDKTDSSINEPTSHIVSESYTSPPQSPSILNPEPKMLTNPTESKPQLPEVPNISVQPASPLPVEIQEYITPGVEPYTTMKVEPDAPQVEPEVPVAELKTKRSFVPGGWDDDEESEKEPEVPKEVTPPPSVSASPPSTGPSIRFDVPPSPPRDVDTDSTDNDSIYSDAYEDLSDADETFGSINAIVESPVSKQSSMMASKYAPTPAERGPSGLRHESVESGEDDVTNSPVNWDTTRDHWSQLNEARKAQPPAEKTATSTKKQANAPPNRERQQQQKQESRQERHIRVGSVEEVPKPKQRPQSTAQPRKSALKKPADAPQTRPAPETHMRKSMRDGPPANNASASEPRFRKSMRDDSIASNSPSSETHMRKSMRGPGAANANRSTAAVAASRHSMPAAESKPPKGTLQKKHIPTAAAAASSVPRQRPQSAIAPAPATKKAPAKAYDSDSDASASSFQRQRPRPRQGGMRTMRMSMRSGSATDDLPSSRPAPAMRAISPPATLSQPPPMKRSMRPTSPVAESPSNAKVKSSRFSIRSLSPAGRFRSKNSFEKPPPSPTQAAPPKMKSFGNKSKNKAPAVEAPKSRFKSRFADSSDEEDDTARRFQSRFADSDDSDEFEMPQGLTPVRGIPRRAGDEDGDSTDLEDEASDTEQTPKPTSTATNGVSNGQSSGILTGTMRDSKYAPNNMPTMEAGKKAKTKRGFFGLGKKKAAPSYIDDAQNRNGATADIPMPPEHRNRDLSRPLSAIGEDKEVATGVGGDRPSSPRSPKLQRRSTPQWGRSTSDSWPLPTPPAIGGDVRPQSSDGVMGRKPTLVKRHSAAKSQGGSVVGGSVDGGDRAVFGRSGKKKKFSGLRKVFGLHD